MLTPSASSGFSRLRLIFYVVGVLAFIAGVAACRSLLTSSGPDCEVTSGYRTAPKKLSESCLYRDMAKLRISPQLRKFTPNYQLWSDGSAKSRWIYLPPDSQIDTSDPDQWIFPVGTQVFKEFRQFTNEPQPREVKVETRHLQKITPGYGEDSWLLSTYQWNPEQTDAIKLSSGARHVLHTDHIIPAEQDCVSCHKGSKDILLGFDAIQLSDAQARLAFGHGPVRGEGEWLLSELMSRGKLTDAMPLPVLPGNDLQQQALGYMHANCGNCHNPMGHAAEQEAAHLKLKHQLAFDSVEKTDVYQTAVNQPTRNFTAVPYIALGASRDELALYQSAIFVRVNSRDENYRMPMLAREKVDYKALDLLHRWLLSIPTPDEVEFDKTGKGAAPPNPDKAYKEELRPLAGKGLQLEVQFFNEAFVPPVMALYLPQDDSLQATPVMDHEDGDFTDALIVGNRGDLMSLRNSDDVGHTIYVNDPQHNIKWQLQYMPPGSEFTQDLFWDNDIFVEMRCRLHLYMSAWVGSISSRYHIISRFSPGESLKRVEMQGYPEEFDQVKIWLPRFTPIDTRIRVGEEQRFDLYRGQQLQGQIRLQRFAQ